ncbi:restriction endonuclease subunit S (plasmid) [Lactiplantibacillus plantarum]|uniref:Restriction endonuclease subunit S n=1 Tax=Lactiplantibacillus plantarum TaxID=1590 RepID=A0AAX1KDG2_LACPN|nr:restriction endonuclease subunit S [Lactiplantibacillus plantarum]QQM62476.1 restriction endonuclease subunit S [Lactiplantibacillus plantarum]
MKDNQAKYPQLRFKGFTDPWEESKLGDTLTELKSGLSRMLSNNDIGLPVVRANNINDGQFNIDSDVKYWYVNDPQGANTVNYLIRKNDILINFINSEAKMGTATIVENTPIRDTIYTTNILRARLKKEYDSYYWFVLTQINQYKINIKIITKPAVNQASFTTVDFKKLNFMFPNLKEQQKIGSFFKQLDDTIALHQRKLAKLKELKQGYLQKLFPRNGSKFPQLRFAGFADAWEQRKLEKLVDVRSGHDYKHLNRGNIPVYGTGGYMLSVDKALSENEDAIGIGRKGTIDNPFLLKAPFWTVDTLFYVVPRVDYNLNFVNSIFQKINWKKYDESTGVPSLSKSTINSVIISFPSYEEQKQIGTFFQQLDKTIALHQRKLKKLQELKKGYLQKMFC